MKWIYIALGLGVTSICNAQIIMPEVKSETYVSAGLGLNSFNNINPSDYTHQFTNDRFANNAISNNVIAKIGIMKVVKTNSSWLNKLVIGGVLYIDKQTRSGNVLINCNSNANKYSYLLGTTSYTPSINAELHFKDIKKLKVHTFLVGSIGLNKITTTYNETPISTFPARPQGALGSKTVHKGSYAIGGGINFYKNSKVQVDLSYLFRYLGNANTNFLTGEKAISVNQNSHNLFLTLNYKIDTTKRSGVKA